MLAIIVFLLNLSLASETCRVGCHYVSASGMPSGGCGSNYQEALFSAQKNCVENVVGLYKKYYEKDKLKELIQVHCTIQGSSQNLLQAKCDNFADDREFFESWKMQVCRYKKEIVFSQNLVWSKWYECN